MSRATLRKQRNRDFYKRIERQAKRARASVKGEAVGMENGEKTAQKANSKPIRWRW